MFSCVFTKALLHQEMENLKRLRAYSKRQSKQAAKEQKNLEAKRQRMMKANCCEEVFGVKEKVFLCA